MAAVPQSTTAKATRRLAAVATAFPLATEAALEILRAGGNAADAAAAAAWALCVCEPAASGLGGQTLVLVHLADGRTRVIDGHSRAPAAASCALIGKDQQRHGYRSATVPSTPATLDHFQRRYGTMSRQRVMAPAIRIAEQGYAITPLQHRQLQWVAGRLRNSAAGDLFLRGGDALPAGHVFRQEKLARTLRRLAETGIADFYTGSAARLIVADMQRNGGLISAEDLATCGSPMEREPISLTYRGHRVLSVPPPGGGLDLLLALKILERLVPGARQSSEARWQEAIALTTSAVFREREARPLVPEEVGAGALAELLSDARATRLADEIAGVARGPAVAAEEPGDTTHLAVSDTQGNVVMLTQSIQSVFGAKVAHPELGFVYNNYLRTCPRGAHPYALRGGGRPRSNACPTLVLGRDGDAPFLALGSAGSRRIISSVLQTASAVIDRGMDAVAAIAAARVHGLLGRKVWIERPAASEALLARLRARDREPVIRGRQSYVMGAVQALHFPTCGELVAAADPRRDGAAAVFDSGDDDEPPRH